MKLFLNFMLSFSYGVLFGLAVKHLGLSFVALVVMWILIVLPLIIATNLVLNKVYDK